MERAGCMSIVEIERMRERGIEEGCTRRSMRPFVAEHAVGSFGQAQRLCRGIERGRRRRLDLRPAAAPTPRIGRAPCRERGCQYGYIAGGAGQLKKNTKNKTI